MDTKTLAIALFILGSSASVTAWARYEQDIGRVDYGSAFTKPHYSEGFLERDFFTVGDATNDIIAGVSGDGTSGGRETLTESEHAELISRGAIVIPKGEDNTFQTTAELGGVGIAFGFDLGPAEVLLTERDALAIGLDPDHLIERVDIAIEMYPERTTSAGVTKFPDIALAAVILTDPFVFVVGDELERSVLGRTFLERFDDYQFKANAIILYPEGVAREPE